MSLNNWITTLTIAITIIPLIKIARTQRFGIYNISIIIIGVSIFVLSYFKNKKDEKISNNKEALAHVSDSTNNENIKDLTSKVNHSDTTLSKIQTTLDSIGIGINTNTGLVSISDYQLLKRIILSPKSLTNVTSINQKGGQTTGSITNNP